jgi:hypothetical protein
MFFVLTNETCRRKAGCPYWNAGNQMSVAPTRHVKPLRQKPPDGMSTMQSRNAGGGQDRASFSSGERIDRL